jgi:hypothetical protein
MTFDMSAPKKEVGTLYRQMSTPNELSPRLAKEASAGAHSFEALRVGFWFEDSDLPEPDGNVLRKNARSGGVGHPGPWVESRSGPSIFETSWRSGQRIFVTTSYPLAYEGPFAGWWHLTPRR